MNKTELLATLTDKVKNKPFPFFNNCTHKPEIIQNVIEEALYGIAEETEIDEEKLQDAITEQADRYTPVYNWELTQWLAADLANSSAVDEYVEEMGIDSKDFSIYRLIACAYCSTLERDAMHILGDLLTQ